MKNHTRNDVGQPLVHRIRDSKFFLYRRISSVAQSHSHWLKAIKEIRRCIKISVNMKDPSRVIFTSLQDSIIYSVHPPQNIYLPENLWLVILTSVIVTIRTVFFSLFCLNLCLLHSLISFTGYNLCLLESDKTSLSPIYILR